MKIISHVFLGRIIVCSNCGALLEWEDNDVYDGNIYCPVCKKQTHIDYNKNYNGIITEEKKNVVQS